MDFSHLKRKGTLISLGKSVGLQILIIIGLIKKSKHMFISKLEIEIHQPTFDASSLPFLSFLGFSLLSAQENNS